MTKEFIINRSSSMDQLTQSEENYIKAIYHLEMKLKGSVGTNELANRTKTKASSVTDMIKRLADKSLIQYEKYKGCELTKKGKVVAKKTIRKHRLWETFLFEKLNFGWDEVHDIAEQLEHVQSTKLTDKLEAFLNFPKFDPHGDPIPNKEGEITHREETVKLSELKEGTVAHVIGVSDSSVSFLRFLDKNDIQLGAKIQIKERFGFDKSAEILLNGKTINLSSDALSKITVQTKL